LRPWPCASARCPFTPEQILAVLRRGKTLYPERFADRDMPAETRRFYADFFGRAPSDAQVRDLLRPP
jgi:hypothetical protein